MDYEKIKPYIEKGLISEQSHPENEAVKIFNYTQECQFSQAWDDVTKQCRGLILNTKTGEVIARPFPKFFNYGEHISKNISIPTEKPVVYPKLDGSLGIFYRLNGKPYIATRGSFTSDQAIWANQFINSPSVYGWLEDLDPEYTHLFEIIYPENRIVVNYDFSGLVHLASIHTKTGKSVEPDSYFPLVSKIDFTSYEELEKLDEPNSEGFVLHYPESDVRIKMKFPEYVRLHKLVTGLSEIAIWEHMRDGKSLEELIEKVPDEFFNWVKNVQGRLQSSYDEIYNQAHADFSSILNGEDQDIVRGRASWRKDFAIRAQETKYPGICFAMLDNKDYNKVIWRMVRPHGRLQFKVDIDQ